MQKVILFFFLSVFVQCSFSQESVYSRKLTNFSNYLLKECPTFNRQTGTKKIAVWDISNQEKAKLVQTQNFTDALVNELPTYLFKQGLGVVDRQKIEAILAEHKMVNIQNPETVKEFGNLIQADAILTGTYQLMSTYIKVRLKLQDVETNEIIMSDIIELPLDNDLRLMLGLEIEENCTRNDYSIGFSGDWDTYANVYISKKALTETINKQGYLSKDVIAYSYIRPNNKTHIADLKVGDYFLLITSSENGIVRDTKKITLKGCKDFEVTVDDLTILSFDPKKGK